MARATALGAIIPSRRERSGETRSAIANAITANITLVAKISGKHKNCTAMSAAIAAT